MNRAGFSGDHFCAHAPHRLLDAGLGQAGPESRPAEIARSPVFRSVPWKGSFFQRAQDQPNDWRSGWKEPGRSLEGNDMD